MRQLSKRDIAWRKANVIRGQNPDVWRKDAHGKKIHWASYGSHGDYGWQLDHIRPRAKGGTNDSRNLQALHW